MMDRAFKISKADTEITEEAQRVPREKGDLSVNSVISPCSRNDY